MTQDFKPEDRQHIQNSADQFEFGNEVDPDSNYILDALLDLEAMIDDEKKQKQQLEKRFDDIRADKKGMPPLKPARGPAGRNNMESIAEEILELVQRRNELADSENIFLNKKAPTTSALAELQAQQDIRTQLMNQFANNQGRENPNAEKRNSRKMINSEALQEMLNKADRGDTIDGSDSDDSDEDGTEEKKPKITRNMRFLMRVQQAEELKQKKIQEEREKLKLKEEMELSQSMLGKPQISDKSASLALKVREKKSHSKKPLYKRVHEVVDQRRDELKQLIKHYEAEENEKFQSECTFKPKISEFDLDSEEEQFGSTHEVSKGRSQKRSAKPGIESFLGKLEDYELQSKVHQMQLYEHYDKAQMREVKPKPQISTASRKIVEGTRGYRPITEKLYELGKDRPKKLEEFRNDYIRELYPFHPNIKRVEPVQLKSTSKSPMTKDLGVSAAKALERLESLISVPQRGGLGTTPKRGVGGDLHVGFSDENDQNRANRSFTPGKSILKTPVRKQDPRRGQTPKTQKKVYFGQKEVKTPKDPQPRTSYRDSDGYVNIIFDKVAIEDLKKSLRFKD